MDSKKAIELIKLSTIGCADKSELSELNTLMAEDENFPWEELGEFQNLAALLPSSMVLETPGWELKDKVARKLYDLRDEITAGARQPEREIKTSKPFEEVVEEPSVEFEPQQDSVNIKTPDLTRLYISGHPDSEVIYENRIDNKESKLKFILDKELIEKTVRDYINTYYKDEIEIMQKSIKKSLLISAVLFIIALLLVVFIYFKFSGETDTNRQEIDKIKNRLGISLLENKAGGSEFPI